MAWLSPTRRVVRWFPLIVSFALAAGAIAALRLAHQPLRGVELTMMSLMLVIGALCGLHDPARDFVHALPVPASRRLVHRLVLIVPVLGFALVVVRGLSSAWFAAAPPVPGWRALVAFGTAGVAVFAVLTRRIGPRAADVAVSLMVAWLVVGVSPLATELPVWLAMPWWRWPLAVASVGGVIAVVATTSGVEA